MKLVNQRFDRKISLYFFSIAMVIVGVLSYANYVSSVNILKENIKQENQQQLQTASLYVASYLEKIKGLNRLIAMTPDITTDIDKSTSEERIRQIIDITKSSDPVIKNMMIITQSGKLLTTTESAMADQTNVLDEPWYQEALASKSMAQITTENHTGFTMDKNERVISLSQEIVDDAGAFIGLSVIDISYQFIEDYISTVNLGKNGFAFIVDEHNQLIFDSQQMNRDSLEEKPDYIAIIDGMGAFEERDYIQSSTYIPNTTWQFVQVRSPEEIYTLNQTLIREMMLWAVLILLISIGLAMIVSKKITNPIVQLIDEMKHVDDRFTLIQEDQQASVEMKALTKEYNLLLTRVKKLTDDISFKESMKRNYELKALQSQINPHFIYNTLDTILWLVELGEQTQAIEVIQSLGTILRNTLNVDDDFTSLKQELEHVESYLAIQQIRYPDTFDYECFVEPNVEEVKVPKLIIQPIVENAIYHGIKPKSSRSILRITAEIQDQDLMIMIQDDGVGFVEEQAVSTKPKLGGIGMSNVHQRLSILYGEGYGITTNRKDGLTTVILKLKV